MRCVLESMRSVLLQPCCEGQSVGVIGHLAEKDAGAVRHLDTPDSGMARSEYLSDHAMVFALAL
jgi:hypothetical protein